MTIPRLVISGSTSGVGKTSITCAIIYGLKKRGHTIQPFKVGPDYIDPSYLSSISNNETKNLDEVISNNKPPIFWKDKDSVKRQANSWKINDLKEKIYQINEVETLIKNNSKNSLNLVSDFIVNI